jgi:H+/Cl- antiporter ClcA
MEAKVWNKIKKKLLMCLIVGILGGVIGGITWGLLFVMNHGIDFFWIFVPNKLNFLLYPVVLCGSGGILIGLWEKKFGSYPRQMKEILGEVKDGKKIPYNNIHIISIAALLPLIFGGCLGPEAGLTGVIVGLCFWFSDKFKFAISEMDEIAEIGIAATVGLVFGSPLFGFINNIEDENKETIIPKNIKILMNFVGIISGLAVYTILSEIFGGSPGLGRFPGIEIMGSSEWLSAIPLALIGSFFGLLYFAIKNGIKLAIRPIKNFIIIKAIIAGIILGGVGIVLPYTMFAGEHQMVEIMNTWQAMGFWLLFLTGVIKLFIGNVCVEMGWRGGNIFPTIFSGVTIGYALATFLPVDPIFCVAVVTTALTTAVMRKPIAVIILLLICFPMNGIIPMCIGAVIGGAIPIPKLLKEKEIIG